MSAVADLDRMMATVTMARTHRKLAASAYPVPELSDDIAAWFAGSVAIGADGNPRPFYHGTLQSFERFDPAAPRRHTGNSVAFYVTGNPYLASEYGPHVLVVFLSVRNPYRVNSRRKVQEITEERREQLAWDGYDAVLYAGEFDEYAVFNADQCRIVASYPSIYGEGAMHGLPHTSTQDLHGQTIRAKGI